jgi:hypothetical protein
MVWTQYSAMRDAPSMSDADSLPSNTWRLKESGDCQRKTQCHQFVNLFTVCEIESFDNREIRIGRSFASTAPSPGQIGKHRPFAPRVSAAVAALAGGGA